MGYLFGVLKLGLMPLLKALKGIYFFRFNIKLTRFNVATCYLIINSLSCCSFLEKGILLLSCKKQTL